MRALSRIALIGILTVLSACAGQNSVQPDLTVQIQNLERTEAQLRIQYNTIGHTLTRLESRIADLKERAAQQNAMAAELPKPMATGPAKPAPLVPVTKPTDITPPPAEVGGLTEADMVDPTAPSAEPAKPAPPHPAAHAPAREAQYSYVVHLASYLDTAPIRNGWRQLSRKYGNRLDGLKPYLTPFMDAQNRRWLRLSVGPLTDAASAKERCDAIKQMGSGDWCEVLRVSTSSMRELRQP